MVHEGADSPSEAGHSMLAAVFQEETLPPLTSMVIVRSGEQKCGVGWSGAWSFAVDLFSTKGVKRQTEGSNHEVQVRV